MRNLRVAVVPSLPMEDVCLGTHKTACVVSFGAKIQANTSTAQPHTHTLIPHPPPHKRTPKTHTCTNALTRYQTFTSGEWPLWSTVCGALGGVWITLTSGGFTYLLTCSCPSSMCFVPAWSRETDLPSALPCHLCGSLWTPL